MDSDSKSGIWNGVSRTFRKFLKDLESESVNKIRSKPVDCCNPPVPSEQKKGSELDSKSN